MKKIELEVLINISSDLNCDITGKKIISEMNYYTFTILIDSMGK